MRERWKREKEREKCVYEKNIEFKMTMERENRKERERMKCLHA